MHQELQIVILENLKMIIYPGSLIELIDDTTGVYMVEKYNFMNTQHIYIEKGFYLVLDTVNSTINLYVEILYNAISVLIFSKNICEVSRIIE